MIRRHFRFSLSIKGPRLSTSQERVPQTLESSVHPEVKIPLWMSAKTPLLDAISSNDLPILRSLLEDQERQLLSQVAQNGTPEIAAYLLSRHPVPEDYSPKFSSSEPITNPTQWLACQSARHGNAPLFCYLLNQYPSLLDNKNRAVEKILVSALEGGVSIWEVILEHDPYWKDYVFAAHRGCVLERVIEFDHMELLEFLLREGADTDREGDPVLEMARIRGASSEMMELIEKYSV